MIWNLWVVNAKCLFASKVIEILLQELAKRCAPLFHEGKGLLFHSHDDRVGFPTYVSCMTTHNLNTCWTLKALPWPVNGKGHIFLATKSKELFKNGVRTVSKNETAVAIKARLATWPYAGTALWLVQCLLTCTYINTLQYSKIRLEHIKSQVSFFSSG